MHRLTVTLPDAAQATEKRVAAVVGRRATAPIATLTGALTIAFYFSRQAEAWAAAERLAALGLEGLQVAVSIFL